MADFVHLHVHSQYSLLDGPAKPSDLAQRAKELDMKAIALTDKGAMYGAIKFYRECFKRGVKPIIGCQIRVVERNYTRKDADFRIFNKSDKKNYISSNINKIKNSNDDCNSNFSSNSANSNNNSDNNISDDNNNNDERGEIYSFILLAKDFEGYSNLVNLINKSHLRMHNIHQVVPFVYEDELIENRDGLIVLTGSLQSRLGKHLLRYKYGEAEKLAKRYLKIFGRENLYLELQYHGSREEEALCRRLIRLGQKLGLKLVATNDVHYLHREDHYLHKLLSQIESMSTTPDSTKERVNNNNYHLKSSIEMERLFSSFSPAIKNSLEIAEKCNLKFQLNDINLPHYQVFSNSKKDLRESYVIKSEENFKDEQYLRKLCYKAIEKKYPGNNIVLRKYPMDNKKLKEIVIKRLEYELGVICDMGYAGYFLIVWDMAKFARERKIPMCAKGSAAGSLVTYLLEISDVDPIKNDLCFERFLNRERGKLPDIDIDFCQRSRDEIFDYMAKRYGKNYVSRVSCFSTLQVRGAIREVGRALNLQKEEIDIIAKRVPHSFMVSLGERNRIDILSHHRKNLPEDIDLSEEPYNSWLDAASKLEGLIRHPSLHPSAFIISNTPLNQLIPLTRANTGEIMSQYDMHDIEDLGLLKLDLISSLSLTMIRDVLASLKKTRGIDLNENDIIMDDPETLEMIRQGRTLCGFQLESSGIRGLLKKIKPRNVMDLTLVISLYRPGPWSSGMVNSFIERMHSREEVDYIHPDLRPILKDTYGVMLYQEQVMKVAQKIGGYSLGEADKLRRAMTGLSKEMMTCERGRFIKGALRRRYSKELVQKVFSLIEKFAGYGFVKAHAAAYALISYKTCYLKAHFPAEVICFFLNNNMGYYLKANYIEEARRLGAEILPPDINKSQDQFNVENRGKVIRVGLLSVKKVGPAAVAEILRVRENRPFKSLYDFCLRISRAKVSLAATENLIKVGAFDFTKLTRRELLLILRFVSRLARNPKAHGTVSFICEDEFDTKRIHFTENNIKGSDFNKNSVRGRSFTEEFEHFSLEERLRTEGKILGFWVSAHPLKLYADILSLYKIKSSGNFHLLKNKHPIIVAGMLLHCRKEKTKKDEEMAFCLLEDEDGMYEVVVFPKVYEKNRYLFYKAGALLIEGEISNNDGDISIIANKICDLNKLF